MLEIEAAAGPRQIWGNCAIDRARRAVEQHLLDANVIVKPFLMT
jgi:hypothetical protein